MKTLNRISAVLLISLAFAGAATAQASDAQSTPAAAAPARGPSGDCDPYKNFDCLGDYLGTGFWERLTNYYKLEMGQAAAPADPKAPPSRREDWPPAAQTTPPMPFTEWPYGAATAIGVTRPGSADSPLMNALGNTAFGTWLNSNNLQLYGWV